jgi:hypothetical protein
MEPFTIRRYQPEDAASVAGVFYRSVREVAASDYGEAQRTAWMPGLRSAGQIHGWAGDGRLVLVAGSGATGMACGIEPTRRRASRSVSRSHRPAAQAFR